MDTHTISREDLAAALRAGVVTVKFKKVNGEERTMKCTLQESALPKSESKDAEAVYNPSVVAVWDLEKSGWRSFRMDSIIEVYK